jgi:hypothetical protein
VGFIVSPPRRTRRLAALAATTCAVLALSAALTDAKDPKWTGPVDQPPGSLGQATVELKIHFGRKKHGSKKRVPKSLMAKERNVLIHCLNGEDLYPGGGGDASTSSKVDVEETIFVKKNRTFNVTDSEVGDSDTSSFNFQGRIGRRTASGTLRMENHRNDGSRPPGDSKTCDSGVLSWTASAP